MKTFFTKTLSLLVLVGFMSSCASGYKAISPESVSYTAKTENNQVLLEYKYDVLGERGNKKYAKRERSKFMQVAAVKITNNSDEVITLGENANFVVGNNSFTPLAPVLAHSQLKQGVPIYLLYLLFTPLQLQTSKQTNGMVTESNAFPLGLILGPGLTLGNMMTAGSANQKFLAELNRNDLTKRQVRPGETLYGLITIPNSSYNPLYLKVGPDPQVQR